MTDLTQKGFSLIELMIAILISTLLILGVTELFSRTSAADRDNTELARMQESGRLALEVIGQDARRAGYQGCTLSNTETPFPGGGTLPNDAASSTAANTVTFRYATPGSGCGTTALNFEPAIVYTSGQDRIIRRNNDPILDNATMAVAFIPAGDINLAKAINIQVTISDSRQGNDRLNDRVFSATYELRNRMQ
ncbi:MAG: prepilin-type N-terminal cleavage/methylation domain-containing protein [Gammaproteobacteria bacterium]|nr:prepilin-type N-terminal cleavage/methylation domain-containing protein [Gammaproteobacteria bacterium]MBU1489077.1 prepilin-type N-terminal cleavage/methylation domain-containing protein [Gammaproteobacteria bacterium]MBU2066103.1 prepilin-type N-terminal cleavage/methylation domain-containing protein [Gammaproteobacteria bacterium]MBU2139937.1 prepilin-type N-terminal cleavage/methylation domain-containing protein [Gammaproteobacteria bacterium]MBU2218788.1 prepilin-type N-terminal cleavag